MPIRPIMTVSNRHFSTSEEHITAGIIIDVNQW